LSDPIISTIVARDSASLPCRRSGRWFLASGIIETTGGVARYRRADENRNLPVSTEITGYAVSALAWLSRVTGDPEYNAAVRHSARFLTGQAWDRALDVLPFECSPGSPSYFFDCGIVVRGLLAAWRLTGEAETREVAERCGRSMARDFLAKDAIHPVIALPARTAVPYEKRWSREPGCYQLKSALAWRDLWVVTGAPEFEEWWRKALGMALATHRGFLTDYAPLQTMDRLHAYSYFLEALCAEPAMPEAREAVAWGIGRVAGLRREIAPLFARSDVYGQLLRVRLLADSLGMAPLDEAAAEEEASTIAGFQYDDHDRSLDGGYCFGTRDGKRMPFVNPVSTAFCMQALDWWGHRFERRARLEDLI
jgi:hypothetical protein